MSNVETMHNIIFLNARLGETIIGWLLSQLRTFFLMNDPDVGTIFALSELFSWFFMFFPSLISPLIACFAMRSCYFVEDITSSFRSYFRFFSKRMLSFDSYRLAPPTGAALLFASCAVSSVVAAFASWPHTMERMYFHDFIDFCPSLIPQRPDLQISLLSLSFILFFSGREIEFLPDLVIVRSLSSFPVWSNFAVLTFHCPVHFFCRLSSWTNSTFL